MWLAVLVALTAGAAVTVARALPPATERRVSRVCAPLTLLLLWGVPYLMQVHGLGRAAAGASASLLLFGWALGAPSFGWLSDRMGRRRPVMLATTAAALIRTRELRNLRTFIDLSSIWG